MTLPYALLVARILHVFSVDLSIESFVHLGWSNYFGKKTLHKLKIFQLNGMWQHGTVDDGDDEDDVEPPQPHDDVQQPVPQALVPPNPHNGQMFSQIMVGIQDLQQGFNNLRINMCTKFDDLQMDMRTRFDRVEERIDQVERKIEDFYDNDE